MISRLLPTQEAHVREIIREENTAQTHRVSRLERDLARLERQIANLVILRPAASHTAPPTSQMDDEPTAEAQPLPQRQASDGREG